MCTKIAIGKDSAVEGKTCLFACWACRWAHDETRISLKLLPLHVVRDGPSLSKDFAANMKKLGTTRTTCMSVAIQPK